MTLKLETFRTHTVNNDSGFIVKHCKTEQLKHSVFVRMVVEWNHLESAKLCTETVEGFKQVLPHRHEASISPSVLHRTVPSLYSSRSRSDENLEIWMRDQVRNWYYETPKKKRSTRTKSSRMFCDHSAVLFLLTQ